MNNDQNCDTEFGGRKLKLLPEKACLDILTNSLIVSDIHIGKEVSMRRQGLSTPNGVSDFDMNRIDELWASYQFTHLYILGDFIHDEDSLSQGMGEVVSKWLGKNAFTTTLILGNHDRHLGSQAENWRMNIVKEDHLGSIRLSHVHCDDDVPTIAGHEHPFVVLKNNFDRLRLPCFYIDSGKMTVPAFGSLTGGFNIKPKFGRRIFAIGDDQVLPLG
ncbi:ligase-associated DNA damage response endonuclease PdeM [Oligoflexaceae bacterium]|nr:ligase-associated DNA damage response endonuclease PdeM [Oligoflexaceae bacterium]